METRPASLSDCHDVVSILCDHYLKETVFTCMTYDHAQTVKKVCEWLFNGSCIVLLDENKIAGLCVVEIGRTFYAEPEADIAMFYIMPEYRKTNASRMLRDSAIEFARQNNAMLLYSLSGSGISEENDSLYCNLWRKAGLSKLGTCMMGQI
jgi:GNAT superfamily N-acetyltransferase